jgi:hypothetical protein
MRISILASSYPEYRALRLQSRSLALVWQAGHAALMLAPLFVFGAAVVVVGYRIDPDLSRERPLWPIVAALFVWAGFSVGFGMFLRRYAIRRGRSVDRH